MWPILYGLMIKMLQYKMYPAGELAVLRQLLFFMRLRSNTSFESHLKSVAPYAQLIYT